MTVYGRIMVVKTLALSKITHLIQVIPNPNPANIIQLQKLINNFIWKGKNQKKVVVNKDIAEQPANKGGLAIPNLNQFWNSLKLAWLTRLITADDDSTWKRLSMARLGTALNIPGLTSTRLLAEGPHTIGKAADTLSNPFWKSLFKLMPTIEKSFYTPTSKIFGERSIWGNNDYLLRGKPLSRKTCSPRLVRNLNKIQDFMSKTTNELLTEAEATRLLGRENVPLWNKITATITTQLTNHGKSWHSIGQSAPGPSHEGWSRMVLENPRAKNFYNLFSTAKASGDRNTNERYWINQGLTTYNNTRWDNLWKNFQNCAAIYGSSMKSIVYSGAVRSLTNIRISMHPYQGVTRLPVPTVTRSLKLKNTYT